MGCCATLEIVPYRAEQHYSEAARWWGLYYDGDPLPSNCLPPTGAVAMADGKPAAVAFLYLTNAKMAMIHLASANPDLKPLRRVPALRSAVRGAIEMARQWLNGEGFIWCCTDSAVVSRVYRELGMTCPGEADVYFLPVGRESSEFLK